MFIVGKSFFSKTLSKFNIQTIAPLFVIHTPWKILAVGPQYCSLVTLSSCQHSLLNINIRLQNITRNIWDRIYKILKRVIGLNATSKLFCGRIICHWLKKSKMLDPESGLYRQASVCRIFGLVTARCPLLHLITDRLNSHRNYASTTLKH